MASRNNDLYNNPAISRAFGNITKALLGDASSDADIARSEYYKSKTTGSELANQRSKELQNSLKNTTGVLANKILQSFTGNNNAGFNQSGTPFVDGGNSSMPVSGQIGTFPNQSYTKDNLSSVANTMLGNLDYKPNQFASMLGNLDQNKINNLATNMMLSGDKSKMSTAFKLLGKSPGKWFDQENVSESIANEKSVGLDKNKKALEGLKYKSNQTLEGSKYKSDKAFDAKTYEVDEKNKITKADLKEKNAIKKELGLEKIKSESVVAKYKFDNRTIKIAVGKDQKVYVDQDTADTLGIEPTMENGEEVYVIDGKASRQKVDQVKVSVGKSDVYLSKEMAEKLGIQKNDNNQYVIKGKGFSSDGSGSGSGKVKMKPKEYFENLNNTFVANEENFTSLLSAKVRGGLKVVMKKLFDKEIKKINDGQATGDAATAYLKTTDKIMSQGVTEIDTGMFSSLNVPTFFYNSFIRLNTSESDMKKWWGSIGYSKDESNEIVQNILQARQAR